MSAHLAVAPIGSTVLIRHDGHPLDGQTVTVLARDHGVGGIGGGGVVDVRTSDGASHPVSRYTRCQPAPGSATR